MKTTSFKPEIADLLARAYALADTPAPELEFSPEELDFDFSAPAPAPAIKTPKPCKTTPARTATGRTEKISIRLRHADLEALRERAGVLGVGYQTLIGQLLRAALATA